MLEFLEYAYIEPFVQGDVISIIFGVMLWVLSLVVVSFVFGGILHFCDIAGVELKEGVGVIIEKGTSPAHTSTTWMTVNKVTVPIITHYPESYYLTISIGGLIDEFVFDDKGEWDKFQEGSKVTCRYGNGRLFDSIHIQSVGLQQVKQTTAIGGTQTAIDGTELKQV